MHMPNDYKKYFDHDYEFIIVDLDTGEIRTRRIDTSSIGNPKMAFNEQMAEWLVETIGLATIYDFGTYQFFWCYDRSKNEYEGGTTLVTIREIVNFYHWWMDNKY